VSGVATPLAAISRSRRRQPVPVIGLAGVGIAGACARLISSASVSAHSLQLNSPRACSASAMAKACASQGFAEHRAIGVAGNAWNRARRIFSGLRIERHQAGSR